MKHFLFSALIALFCVSAPVAQTGSLDDPLPVPLGGTIGPIPNPLGKVVAAVPAVSADGGATFVGGATIFVNPGENFEVPIPDDPDLCEAIIRFCVFALCPETGAVQDLGCIYYRIEC